MFVTEHVMTVLVMGSESRMGSKSGMGSKY